MTKDVDNRLYGHRRYFYSLDLKKPEVIIYIDLKDDKYFLLIADIRANYEIVYESDYLDPFENKIEFVEYKKRADEESAHEEGLFLLN